MSLCDSSSTSSFSSSSRSSSLVGGSAYEKVGFPLVDRGGVRRARVDIEDLAMPIEFGSLLVGTHEGGGVS